MGFLEVLVIVAAILILFGPRVIPKVVGAVRFLREKFNLFRSKQRGDNNSNTST